MFAMVAWGLSGCLGGGDQPAASDPVSRGQIAYPFVDETAPLGKNGPDDKFVIRSAVGNAEYTVEIPGAAQDYDVAVPLADMAPAGSLTPGTASHEGNAITTDREITAAFPRLDRAHPTDTAILDQAFGVGENGGPRQAPSYTKGVARINEHYKRRQYEYALIDINNLLAFYPNSVKLLKMKGTILQKMRNFTLAEQAWLKALQLDPRDRVLNAALQRLQRKIMALGQTAPAGTVDLPDAAVSNAPPMAVPAPVGQSQPQFGDQGVLPAH